MIWQDALATLKIEPLAARGGEALINWVEPAWIMPFLDF
jgi:hypothetical protein